MSFDLRTDRNQALAERFAMRFGRFSSTLIQGREWKEAWSFRLMGFATFLFAFRPRSLISGSASFFRPCFTTITLAPRVEGDRNIWTERAYAV